MCKQLLSSAPPCSAADRQLPLLSLLQPLNNCHYITVASSARSIRHSNAQMGRFQVSQGPITRNTYPVVYLEIRTDLEPPDTSPSVKGTGNRCRQGTRSRRGVTTFRKTTRRCWQAVEERPGSVARLIPILTVAHSLSHCACALVLGLTALGRDA